MRMLQKKCNDISMPQQYKARDIKIDFMKGILIFLVVLGHSIQYGSGVTFFSGECYFDDILFKIIYTFHMPCFGILSGYLYQQHVRNRTIAKKNTKNYQAYISNVMLCHSECYAKFSRGQYFSNVPCYSAKLYMDCLF